MLLNIAEPYQKENRVPEIAVGIDLGTTHSLVAISIEGRPRIIQDANGQVILPSIVAGEKLGFEAAQAPDAIHSIKRQMGKGINNEQAVRLSAQLLAELKRWAEADLKQKVTKAVITVPAYFDDAARNATKDAAQLAGLDVLRLVNEPTSAALAYGLDQNAEGLYLVYDLGGGTFDISLLKMEKGVFQVLATGGNTELGGDDFDQVIAKAYGISFLAARKAKERLSEEVTIELDGKHITRERINYLVNKLVQHTISLCDNVLLDAQIVKQHVKGLIMVGGSTRMPYVREKLQEWFGKPILTNLDPEKVVAMGAALQAENLTSGSDMLLLDVTPLSLGLETIGGLVEKIILRNTPIPASATQAFTTYQEGQGGISFHVLQGERELVDQCRSLARFELTGIPYMPAGKPRVEVTFTLDADGLLTVSARETTTNISQKIEVKPSYGLSAEKIEQMLIESMEHAREDITLRLLAESRLEATQAVEAVESALAIDRDLLNKGEFEAITWHIGQLKQLLLGHDRDRIDYEMQRLNHIAQDFMQKRANRALQERIQGHSIERIEGELHAKNDI